MKEEETVAGVTAAHTPRAMPTIEFKEFLSLGLLFIAHILRYLGTRSYRCVLCVCVYVCVCARACVKTLHNYHSMEFLRGSPRLLTKGLTEDAQSETCRN